MLFNASFNGTQFIAICDSNGLQQEFQGNKALASLLSKLLPVVESSTTISYDSISNELSNQATLCIRFSIPSWFPVPADRVEQGKMNTVICIITLSCCYCIARTLTSFSVSIHSSIALSIHLLLSSITSIHPSTPSHVPAGSQIISETIMKDMNGFMDVFLSKYEAEMQSK